MSAVEWEVDERRTIDGVLYRGMACEGCGTVYGVAEQAMYDVRSAAGHAVKFFCAGCQPPVPLVPPQ